MRRRLAEILEIAFVPELVAQLVFVTLDTAANPEL